jgi:hypothetical protein
MMNWICHSAFSAAGVPQQTIFSLYELIHAPTLTSPYKKTKAHERQFSEIIFLVLLALLRNPLKFVPCVLHRHQRQHVNKQPKQKGV